MSEEQLAALKEYVRAEIEFNVQLVLHGGASPHERDRAEERLDRALEDER